jgi:phospholipase/carboxylesterase
MNPIDSSTHSKKRTAPTPPFEIESALFSRSLEDRSHAFFAPLHYEPKCAYPLLVWLHGPGRDDERQLVRIMPLISMRNYAAAAPRGFHLHDSGSLGWPQNPQSIESAMHRVFDCMEAARERFNISSKRVFLGGFDGGGTMAFRIALNHPESFAGVLSLGGALPQGHQPFGRLVAARRLPAFLAMGRDSDTYGPNQACDDLRLLHTAGVSVTLRQYPCGHQLTEQMLRDVDRWIMEQITMPAEVTGPVEPT